MTPRRWLLTVSLLTSLTAHAGGSDSLLADALQAARRWEYRQALALARAGLAVGDATPEVTAKLYAVQGEVAAAMGEGALAEDAFTKVLLLSPAFEIPADASPKVREPFQRARTRVGAERLAAAPLSERRADQVLTRVKVTGDPLQLTDRVTLRRLSGPSSEELPLARTEGWELRWGCSDSRCDHLLTLRDRQGNALLSLGTRAAPLQIDKTLAAPARPWHRHPLVYGAGAAAFAAAGSVFAVRAAREDAELAGMLSDRGSYTFTQARDLQGLRQRDALLGGGFFVLAAACAVGVVIVW